MNDEPKSEAADRVAVAGRLNERIAEIEREITLEFKSLAGTVERSLAMARADLDAAIGLPEAKEEALRRIVVDASLRTHEAEGLAKARSEPELLHEWVGTGVTSVAAVKPMSWLGRVSGRVAVISLFLGFVGVGAQAVSPGLMQKIATLEVTLVGDVANQELRAALAELPVAPEPSTPPELASDDETIQQLRSAYRSSFARSLLRSGGVELDARRSRELAAVKARQDILAASARPAAPPLASGVPPEVIGPRVPDPPAAARTVEEVLDEALDRRIPTLRSEEGLWHRLRAAAARPAPPDLVADQLLRAVFNGSNPFADAGSVALQHWVERSATDFAVAAARTGQIPHNHRFTTGIDTVMQGLSARDRRLLADFEGEAPQKVASILDDIRSGRSDPGSLHRVAFTPTKPTGGAGGGVANAFAEMFPAVVADAASSGATFRPGASRSYAKIRFSPRIGGVVIGRPPEEAGETIDVTDFDWRLTADGRLAIDLTSVDGGRVAIGEFHPAIAHHALAYAADGRVVVSTLPQPTSESRIPARPVIVHPAFEDTAFACPAIQVDRFVDAFTDDSEKADAINESRDAVTFLGEVIAIGPNVEALASISYYGKACGIGDKCFPIDLYERCGIDFGSTGRFLQCLSEKDNAADCLTMALDLRARATFLVDSGVREASYSLDKQFKFLSAAAHRHDPLWPMDFIIQAVPIDLGKEGDSSAAVCAEVWEFPQQRKAIRQTVAEGIARDANASRVFADMRDFVVLQRLFRLALDGRLGADFPLYKLTEIQRATRPFVRVERNERWNLNVQLVRYIMAFHVDISDALKAIGGEPGVPTDCAAAAKAQLAAVEQQPWPRGVSFWPSIAETANKCQSTVNGNKLRQMTDRLQRDGLIDEAIYLASQPEANSGFFCTSL